MFEGGEFHLKFIKNMMNRQPPKRFEPKPTTNRYGTNPKPTKSTDTKNVAGTTEVKPKPINKTACDLEIADE